MQVRNILLVLVVVQIGLIAFGGFLYSLIPIEQRNDDENCSVFSSSSLSLSPSTISVYYDGKDDHASVTNSSSSKQEKEDGIGGGDDEYPAIVGEGGGEEVRNVSLLTNNSTPTTTSMRPSFSDSIFFVVTTVTTIGYGKFSPTSTEGKIFTIIVAFIGVPVNIVILAKIGEVFKNMFTSALKPLSKHFKRKKLFMVLQLLFAITVGSICFVLVPGGLITFLESWSYIDSIYYVFVTLFTIGFGDFVAGSDLELGHYNLMVYRFLLYMWMYLGMAYISLIVNLCLEFLQQNAENLSKEIRSIIEEKIHLTIKRHLVSRRTASKRNKLNKDNFEVLTSNEVSIIDVETNNNNAALKLKINYDEEKLTELAEKRRASRIQQQNQQQNESSTYGSSNHRFKSYTNEIYFQQETADESSKDSRRRESAGSSGAELELKMFENNFYSVGTIKEEEEDEYEIGDEANSSSSSCSASNSPKSGNFDLLQADDDCLKIDMEILPDRATTTSVPHRLSGSPLPRVTLECASLSTVNAKTPRSKRVSIESLSNADALKSIFNYSTAAAAAAAAAGVNTTINTSSGNNYDNDLYGLVRESDGECDDSVITSRRSSKGSGTATASSSSSSSGTAARKKRRRMTEFEIYMPVLVDKFKEANYNLFTKI